MARVLGQRIRSRSSGMPVDFVAVKFFDYQGEGNNSMNYSDAVYVDQEIDRQRELSDIQSIAELFGCAFDTELGLLRRFGQKKLPRNPKYKVTRQKIIIMELLQGGEIFDAIITRGTFTQPDASIVLEQVAHTYDQMHARRRINPDFKLENCMFAHAWGLAPPGENSHLLCKIIDMGMVKVLPEGQRDYFHESKSMLGTDRFVAPESRADGTYSAKSDVFQLGCFLHLMLHAEFAHYGPGDMHVMQGLKAAGMPMPDLAAVHAALGVGGKLLQLMLEPDCEKRISLTEVLAHPFITHRHELSTADLGPEYIQRIRALKLRKRFRSLLVSCAEAGRQKRQAVEAVLAASIAARVPGTELQEPASGIFRQPQKLSCETFKQLREAFLKAAKGDVRSKVPRAACISILAECGFEALATEEACSILDGGSLEGVGYFEFVITLTAFRLPLNPVETAADREQKQLDSTFFFEILDLNLDGKLTLEEVVSVLGVVFNVGLFADVVESDIVELFHAIDFDDNGSIDAGEFKAFLDHSMSTAGGSIGFGAGGNAGGGDRGGTETDTQK